MAHTYPADATYLVFDYFLNSNKNIFLFDIAGKLCVDSNMLDELTVLVKKT